MNDPANLCISDICNTNDFDCENGICVSADAECDGFNDCVNWAEENQCGTYNYIYADCTFPYVREIIQDTWSQHQIDSYQYDIN